MTNESKAKQFISTLENDGFYAECPACEETVRLKDCDLFHLNSFPNGAREVFDGLKREQRERADELIARRKSICATSEIGAQSVNMGLILERLAPCMASFPFERSDCRSLFDPIDYLIFEGLSAKGVVSKIVFMEIKTGGASLKPSQKQIRSLVQSKKVSLAIYKRKQIDE
jgi:predicted Holliday junction resolvase-like endonuclease